MKTTTALGVIVILALAGWGIFAMSDMAETTPTTNTNETASMNETPEWNTNAAGLGILITTAGSGLAATHGDTVSVHYTGTLEDGTVFDSSIPRGEPITFVLGQGRVIAGWEQGILGMQVGEKRTLNIPSELGYGAQGAPGAIPPNATLIFDVELVAIQ